MLPALTASLTILLMLNYTPPNNGGPGSTIEQGTRHAAVNIRINRENIA
jgi:hypothetical protein